MNGLHKASFFHSSTQPGLVPGRRRDIAAGVARLCVCLCTSVGGLCASSVCVGGLAKGMRIHSNCRQVEIRLSGKNIEHSDTFTALNNRSYLT